jgi:hypothetical protein
MAIYLDDFRKARALNLPAGSCGGELRNLNWTPTSAVDGFSCSEAAAEPSPQLPDDFVGTDMRALMQRLRALASQI